MIFARGKYTQLSSSTISSFPEALAELSGADELSDVEELSGAEELSDIEELSGMEDFGTTE